MSTTEKTTEKPVAREEVVLAGPHTHEGKPYDKGGKIKVTPRQKAFLEEQGKLEKPAARVEKEA